MLYRFLVDQSGFLVPIIIDDDSLNKTFLLKEQDVKYMFLFLFFEGGCDVRSDRNDNILD